jgi:hypothetical protein
VPVKQAGPPCKARAAPCNPVNIPET